MTLSNGRSPSASWPMTPGILLFILRASFPLFNIALGKFVAPNVRETRGLVERCKVASKPAVDDDSAFKACTTPMSEMARLNRLIAIDLGRCPGWWRRPASVGFIADPGVIHRILDTYWSGWRRAASRSKKTDGRAADTGRLPVRPPRSGDLTQATPAAMNRRVSARVSIASLGRPLCRSHCLLFIRRHAPAKEIEDRLGGITSCIDRTCFRTSVPVVS